MLHIAKIGNNYNILQGFQTGVEVLDVAYTYQSGSNGNHQIVVANDGNGIDFNYISTLSVFGDF